MLVNVDDVERWSGIVHPKQEATESKMKNATLVVPCVFPAIFMSLSSGAAAYQPLGGVDFSEAHLLLRPRGLLRHAGIGVGINAHPGDLV